MKEVVFIDLEINSENNKVKDFGAIASSGSTLHTGSKEKFSTFVNPYHFVAGHNIVDFDLQFCSHHFQTGFSSIDTLFLSPLLFPTKPYHKLVKDDKLISEQLNNPLNDAMKARDLFYDEVNAYNELPGQLKNIYASLLKNDSHFEGFFEYVGAPFSLLGVERDIKKFFVGKICQNANLSRIINKTPVGLAYALALIGSTDKYSITPPWISFKYPEVQRIIHELRESPCSRGCDYCNSKLDARKRLKDFFGFDNFRTYDGEPLQENAAKSAIAGESLLAIFPTGGGKSITFQLPALISGEISRGLTVVISPLQSLMKDQVDNLEQKGIADAVTVNGLLSPVERAESIRRVEEGIASILYLSPESLRSRTMERILLKRNVVRFVIDEAHCFSSWGQDFRVDYLYIGKFIREYCTKKKLPQPIPVSCFTATAKQKVISDIKDYFRKELGLELNLFATSATRKNLHYAVIYKETEDAKYAELRRLIDLKKTPTIVYVSTTKKTVTLADRLTADGYPAKPFNGKMDSSDKIENQNAFINNQVQVIVATSAFGMGVDKKDVGLVVHYEISDSLENYVQEAGRAGRDQAIQADCFVLFNEDDLNKHFMMLNQTKLSLSEIQQVWQSIKELSKNRPELNYSALEIARKAGWDDAKVDVETRVRTAIAALENAGYVERGKNMPHVYATGILAQDMIQASAAIEASSRFNDKEKENAKRIIKSLISSRSIAKAGNDDAESRVDYLADILGLTKEDVIDSITMLREEGILADSQDMAAYIKKTESRNHSSTILARFSELEKYLAEKFNGEIQGINYKEINDNAIRDGIKGSTVSNIITILYFWTIKGYIKKRTTASTEESNAIPEFDSEKLKKEIDNRLSIANYIVDYLFEKKPASVNTQKEEDLVQFSVLELLDGFNNNGFWGKINQCSFRDIQDALLYLSKIGSLSLEGGFLVSYNGLSIKRLVMDNKIRYKIDDYKQLDEYYQLKIQQIHIVGEYANMMIRDYDEALGFVNDYFQMEYKSFVMKYFIGNRLGEINRNITPERYDKLFGSLSDIQNEIIRDDKTKNIVVVAGPGSGKTRVLVHKLASLLLLEDVKSEQLLMLTFSRAAATEFKQRLIQLIGNAAYYVEIKTFHSYCFDLLGQIGSIEESDGIVQRAAEMIENGEVELGRITKTVLVIDEAQDMDEHEFALVRALMTKNDDMRVIAVGDDDQNIYSFRGADSKYMHSLVTDYQAKQYSMVDNYRSTPEIVCFTNAFAKNIGNRMKNEDIHSVRPEGGIVSLVKYQDTVPPMAVVHQLQQMKDDCSKCILTPRNEDALTMFGLLTENGIASKLIQSNDEFNLFNLAEIRFFIKQIGKDNQTPTISDTVWNQAKKELIVHYGNSSCMSLIKKMIQTFEELNRTKYHSDFIEYVKESKLEDFYEKEQGTVFVSTIHKSKGREFDSVFLYIPSAPNFYLDEVRRAFYVGMTRAKDNLYLHYVGDYLDRFRFTNANYTINHDIYRQPQMLMIPMTHRDVFLSFFKGKKKDILSLQSGSPLRYNNGSLYSHIGNREMEVVKLSKKAFDFVSEYQKKGYTVEKAEVRFVVAWKDKEHEEEDELAIILPDIHLRRQDDESTKQK